LSAYLELIRFLRRFIGKQKGVFAAILLLDCLNWPLDVLLWPYILRLAVDAFLQFDGDRMAAWPLLKIPAIAGVCLVLYIETASRTMAFLMAKGIPRLLAEIRMAMFDHIQRHSPRYFSEQFSGALASRISDMVQHVESILLQIYWPIVPAVATCLLGAFFLWFISPAFTAIFLGWAVLHLAVCIRFARPVDAYEERHGEARNALVGKIVDSFSNHSAVNLFCRFGFEKRFLAPFQKKEEETNEAAKRMAVKMQCYLSLFYILGGFFGMNGALLYFWMHGHISTGQVVQVFAMMMSLAMVLWNVSSSLPVLFQSFGGAKQAFIPMQEPEDLGGGTDRAI